MASLRHIAGTVGLVVTFVAASGIASADDRRQETPQEVYKRDVGCVAILDAALARTHDPALAAKAKDPLEAFQTSALAAGQAVGKAPDAVRQDIDRQKQAIAKRFADATSPEATKKQDGDLGKTVIACALVAAIEAKTGK